MTADAAVRGIREHDADGVDRAGRRRVAPAVQAPAADERPLERAATRRRSGSTPRRRAPSSSSAAASSRSISTRAARPTTRATSTATRSSCSRPAARRGGSAATTTQVVYYRTLDDYRTLTPIADGGAHVVVIGGGFIGSELAAGAHERRREGDDGLPRGRRHVARAARRARAVRRRATTARRASRCWPRRRSRRSTGSRSAPAPGATLEADAVVGGLGIVPNVELAEAAGLPVDNGIVVDEFGRVDGRDDVFAAGDVANYPNLVLGGSSRVEHEDHANTHGRDRRREHGRREQAVRPPAVLLLRPLRPRLRGRRRGRLAARDGRDTGRSRTARARSPTSTTTGRPRGVPALERLGQGRRCARADPRGRAGRRRSACLSSRARGRRGCGRRRSARSSSVRSRISSCSRSRRCACRRRRSCSRATAFGVAGAVELARGHLVVAALLVQAKTVFDNADGQLARLTGRVTAFGRYLDSECDLLVDAALFAGARVVHRPAARSLRSASSR